MIGLVSKIGAVERGERVFLHDDDMLMHAYMIKSNNLGKVKSNRLLHVSQRKYFLGYFDIFHFHNFLSTSPHMLVYDAVPPRPAVIYIIFSRH
jgi:hypothetical protein